MNKYTIKITDKAEQDMENNYTYIAMELLSPETAMEQYIRIADAIMTLDIFPERIRLIEAEPEHSQGIRALLIDHYTVFYFISQTSVYVTRVLYSASDLRERLNNS